MHIFLFADFRVCSSSILGKKYFLLSNHHASIIRLTEYKHFLRFNFLSDHSTEMQISIHCTYSMHLNNKSLWWIFERRIGRAWANLASRHSKIIKFFVFKIASFQVSNTLDNECATFEMFFRWMQRMNETTVHPHIRTFHQR